MNGFSAFHWRENVQERCVWACLITRKHTLSHSNLFYFSSLSCVGCCFRQSFLFSHFFFAATASGAAVMMQPLWFSDSPQQAVTRINEISFPSRSGPSDVKRLQLRRLSTLMLFSSFVSWLVLWSVWWNLTATHCSTGNSFPFRQHNWSLVCRESVLILLQP